jgi:hypothetical protein
LTFWTTANEDWASGFLSRLPVSLLLAALVIVPAYVPSFRQRVTAMATAAEWSSFTTAANLVGLSQERRNRPTIEAVIQEAAAAIERDQAQLRAAHDNQN